MKIGVPAEIMNSEGRVALSPAAAQALVDDGHEVLIQSGAGEGSSYLDSDYADRGASIVDTAADAWAAEMVLKVKEPLQEEYQYLREDLLLFTYLHLAASREMTDALVEAGAAVVRGLEDTPWGHRSFGLDDPDGLRIWLVQDLRA